MIDGPADNTNSAADSALRTWWLEKHNGFVIRMRVLCARGQEIRRLHQGWLTEGAQRRNIASDVEWLNKSSAHDRVSLQPSQNRSKGVPKAFQRRPMNAPDAPQKRFGGRCERSVVMALGRPVERDRRHGLSEKSRERHIARATGQAAG